MDDKKEFSTAAVLSLTTGILLGGSFGDVHLVAEWVAGHSIWTHEFASKETWQRLRDLVFLQHPQLKDESGDGIAESNWREHRSRLEQKYGDKLVLIKGSDQRLESPFQTAEKLCRNKPIIGVVFDNNAN